MAADKAFPNNSPKTPTCPVREQKGTVVHTLTPPPTPPKEGNHVLEGYTTAIKAQEQKQTQMQTKSDKLKLMSHQLREHPLA